MKKKTKNIIFSVLGGLALVGTGLGLGFGLTSGYSHDDTTYVEVEEIWLADDYKFDGTNLSALCSYITGVEGSTSEDLSGEYTSEDIRTVNDGLDIVVTLGGLKWSVVFVQGSVITLWLTNSEQDYFTEYYNEHGNYFDYATFYQSGTGTGLYAPWTSGWTSSTTDNGTVDFYPANSYGTSYIRTVVLNNSSLDGERFNYYATGNDNVVEHYQDWDHIFAPFTMFDYNAPQNLQDEGIFGLKSFLVPLCEYSYVMGQVSNYDYQIPNESTDNNRGFGVNGYVTGSYYNESFNYSEHHNYETNIGYYQWLEDTLWLPSFTEVSASGLWATSTEQRANVNGSNSVASGIYGHTWLRSGYYNAANRALRITAAGAATIATGGNVNYKCGVRPALHLNLDKASKYTTGLNWINQADTSWKGLGTESSPYLISSAEELAGIAYNVNISGNAYPGKYFKQTANIDLAGFDWTAIGTTTTPFAGIYDGGDFKIEGLNILTDVDFQGLFGKTSRAKLYNLKLSNFSIYGGSYTGAFVGEANELYMYNCSTDIGIVNGNDKIGGLVGKITNSKSDYYILNSYNMAEVTGRDGVGGISGDCTNSYSNDVWTPYTMLQKVYNKGTVKGKTGVGGLLGNAGIGLITQSYNEGNILGTSSVGGLIGTSTTYRLSVEKCYSKGIIEGGGHIGGLVGYLGTYEGYFYDCAVYGILKLLDSNSVRGGLCGDGSTSYANTFSNCSVNIISNLDCQPFLARKSTLTTISGCYSKIGVKKYYSSGDFSGYTIVNNMNNGLPIQNNLYSIATGGYTSEEVIADLQSKGFVQI